MKALLRPDAKLERVTGREPPSPQTFPQEGFNCRPAPTFQSTCSSSFQSLTPDVCASEKSCRWEDLIKKKKRGFCRLPATQTRQDRTGEIGFLLCLRGGVRWGRRGGGDGAGIRPMLSDYREIRAERRPENVADLGGSCAGEQAAGVGKQKRERVGERVGERGPNRQISFRCSLFLYTIARAGPALSPPRLSQIRRARGRSFHSARERERPQRVHAQVAVRPVHVIHH